MMVTVQLQVSSSYCLCGVSVDFLWLLLFPSISKKKSKKKIKQTKEPYLQVNWLG